MRTITMIVRMPKPSMRYAVTTCFDSFAASSLGARRPSFSNAAQRDGEVTIVGAAAGAAGRGGSQVIGAVGAGAGAPGNAVIGAYCVAGAGNAARGVPTGAGGGSGTAT